MIDRLRAPKYYYNFSILDLEKEFSTNLSDAYENNSQSAFLIENRLEKQAQFKGKENVKKDRDINYNDKEF